MKEARSVKGKGYSSDTWFLSAGQSLLDLAPLSVEEPSSNVENVVKWLWTPVTITNNS